MQKFSVRIWSDTAEITRLARWVRDLAHRLALPDDITFRLDLCLEEAVHNIIRYGYSGPGLHAIDVKIGFDSVSLILEVEDDGVAFDPSSVPDLLQPASLEEAAVGGWGVHLIRRFSDHCCYERRGEKNRLKLLFALPYRQI